MLIVHLLFNLFHSTVSLFSHTAVGQSPLGGAVFIFRSLPFPRVTVWPFLCRVSYIRRHRRIGFNNRVSLRGIVVSLVEAFKLNPQTLRFLLYLYIHRPQRRVQVKVTAVGANESEKGNKGSWWTKVSDQWSLFRFLIHSSPLWQREFGLKAAGE